MQCGQSFRICKKCGNLTGMIHDSGTPMFCCGREMSELIPNSVDASKEKHVPVIQINGAQVSVEIGAEPHPMTEAHAITWIYLKEKSGGQRRCLKFNAPAKTVFTTTDPEAIYAYCNLHGLWIKEI